MNNQLKLLSFSLIGLKTSFKKKEDNITFDEKSMILGYEKDTERGVILGNILVYVAKWTIWKKLNVQLVVFQNCDC